MKHFTVSELQAKRYIEARLTAVGGSRPQLILIHRSKNEKYFFKTYTHTTREVWVECLASHLAKLIGIKAQAVTIKIAPPDLRDIIKSRFKNELPSDWEPVGTLSRNIFPRHIEIRYGAYIVETPTSPLSLEDIELRIRSKYYAPDDILQDYADMVVFDAFIGNMDRHHENWGVCEDKKYKQLVIFDKKQTKDYRYFTPLFDHGSSLMFELDDDKVSNMLQDSESLERYVYKSKFGFILNSDGEHSNMFEILERHLRARTKWGKRFKLSLAKVVNVNLLDVSALLLQMPVLPILSYSLERRNLLYKGLLLRYNKLNEIYKEV